MDYFGELEKIIDSSGEKKPSVLLHCCCAPCSSYCLEYLTKYFKVTVYFYNPNITDKNEYDYRLSELKRFVCEVYSDKVEIIEERYEPEEFFRMAKGYEECPERGERCRRCFYQRLESTAVTAKKLGFDYFTTTLSISPYKSAEDINRIGEALQNKLKIDFLPSDFKKNNGYKRSIELSEEHKLYRQNYCGCIFSLKERFNGKTYTTDSVEKTIALAKDFAKTLKGGDVVLLNGDMGVGKTVFTKGIALGLNINELITSPTYAYMNSYSDKLYHFDCYRLECGEQAEGLGLTDYFYADGVCVIEWSENIASVLPDTAITIKIERGEGNERKIIF